MNHLIVVALDHLDDARAAMRDLRALERDGRVSFEDTAIVERMPDGSVHVRDEVSGTTETTTAVGAIAGGLLFWFFPPVGIALGAAAGALVGVALDRGVGGAFVDEVKRTLTPGRSALFLVVRQIDADAVIAALRPYGGEVLQTTLPAETEDALRQALAR